MTELTEAQKEVLRANRWKRGNGSWYKCRVCGGILSNWAYVWFSPRMAGYHPGCVLESKQVQRLLKQAGLLEVIK